MLGAARLDKLEAKLCRNSFKEFVKRFWECIPGAGKLIWNWHLDVFCDEIEVVYRRIFNNQPREYDLVINVPFGTSKSSIISVLSQAWAWTNAPWMRFLCGTHTDSLALDLATRARDVIASEKYRRFFPEVVLRHDRASKEDYQNTAGGERKSCTVGGKTPTGRHSHVLLVDDPIDPQGVRSDVELETASKFMTEVLPGRKTDKLVAVTILVMQRLHYRDPSATMLEGAKLEGAFPVRHICLPGELDKTEDGYSSRGVSPVELAECYQKGLLDPKRLSQVILNDYKAKLGIAGYNAQVKQDPRLPGGGMFEVTYFNKRVRAAPYDAKRIRYFDRAATQDGGCYTAGVLIARDREGFFYVEDVVHGQWEPNERNKRITATAQRDRAKYGPRYEPMIYIEAERGSTGLEAYQALARKLAGYRIREDQPTGSKDVRAESWSDQLAAGNVYLVENGQWDINGYIEEHTLFKPQPGKRLGKLKDRVDASSGCCNLLINKAHATKQMRVLTARDPKWKGPRLVVCDDETLPTAIIEDKALLVCILDPLVDGEEVMFNETVVRTEPFGERALVRGVQRGGELSTSERGNVNGAGETVTSRGFSQTVVGLSPRPCPPHGLAALAAPPLVLAFCDLDPADIQDQWHDPMPPWNKTPDQLVMQPADGKKVWSLLARQRSDLPPVIVFHSPRGQRALSMAMAVADVLRLPRDKALFYAPDGDDAGIITGKAPNGYVYDQTKRSRGLVV